MARPTAATNSRHEKREAGKPPFLVLNKKSLKCLAVLGDLEPINKQVEACSMTILPTRGEPGSALPKQVCNDLSCSLSGWLRPSATQQSVPVGGAALVEVAS